MKIVSLNVRQGGGERVPRLLRYLASVGPDVVVLTEFRQNPNAPLFRQGLAALGLSFHAAAPTTGRENSVGIFARASCSLRSCPEPAAEDAHRVISVQVGSLHLCGVYFPQQQAKARLFAFLRSALPVRESAPLLVVGDYNTGQHHVDEAGASFHCANDFASLTGNGYIDCWRSRNPAMREFTWYSNAGNGFRIDHAFANATADERVQAVYYDHDPRTSRVTDHSALIIELDF
eukprot:TRINITY_DN21456_c0_g2_i3.p1 TRINITY_DN21456_c0_g2~~TRINITY_DN21456_c0_g2_i3.p1  ORF type:complete len:233 (+),score=27.18 TRINITY_DN21456_c0_g2_i3:196-894(+)